MDWKVTGTLPTKEKPQGDNEDIYQASLLVNDNEWIIDIGCLPAGTASIVPIYMCALIRNRRWLEPLSLVETDDIDEVHAWVVKMTQFVESLPSIPAFKNDAEEYKFWQEHSIEEFAATLDDVN